MITHGVTNASICDLQLQKIHLASKDLAYILNDPTRLTNLLSNKEAIVDDVLLQLLEDGCIIQVLEEDLDSFVNMPTTFDVPSEIYNAIIDRDPVASPIPITAVCKQLHELRCKFVEIRYYKNYLSDDLQTILESFENSTIEMINLYVPFSATNIKSITEFKKRFVRISSVFIHSVPQEITNEISKSNPNFLFTEQVIENETHCGTVSPFYFSANIPTISESKNFNSCLYKKVGIDAFGNIKNCPSMKDHFGNIMDTSIVEVVRKEDFKKVWGIKKDDINVCAVCEFRYVCTDCRAYIEQPTEIHSKPLKCGYNPYTGIWDNWDSIPEKLETMNLYLKK